MPPPQHLTAVRCVEGEIWSSKAVSMIVGRVRRSPSVQQSDRLIYDVSTLKKKLNY